MTAVPPEPRSVRAPSSAPAGDVSRRAFLAAGAAFALAPLAGCAAAQPAPVDPHAHPLAGLVDFTGKAVPPPAIMGAVTIVDFWASWCGPCRQGFRYMDQLFRTYEGDGLVVLGVSVDEDGVAARRFWAQMRPRFPVAWDQAGGVRARFGVASLPTTVLFDPQGSLVQRNEGFDPRDHRLLEEHVHRLLRT